MKQYLIINNSKQHIKLISGFRREVDGICALQGYYAASSGNILPTFLDNLSVPSSGVKNLKKLLTLEDGTDKFSPNVGKKLPLLAA